MVSVRIQKAVKELQPELGLPASLEVPLDDPSVLDGAHLYVLAEEEAVRTAGNAVQVEVVLARPAQLREQSVLQILHLLLVLLYLYLLLVLLGEILVVLLLVHITLGGVLLDGVEAGVHVLLVITGQRQVHTLPEVDELEAGQGLGAGRVQHQEVVRLQVRVDDLHLVQDVQNTCNTFNC